MAAFVGSRLVFSSIHADETTSKFDIAGIQLGDAINDVAAGNRWCQPEAARPWAEAALQDDDAFQIGVPHCAEEKVPLGPWRFNGEGLRVRRAPGVDLPVHTPFPKGRQRRK